MGKLIDGKWTTGSIISSDKKGAYDRIPRSFRGNISKSDEVFKPDSGRYHLYVSYACPWATRVLMYRSLKGLEEHISVNVVHPHMLENGWSFDKNFPGSTGDDLFNLEYLHQIYQKADPQVTTSVSVPVLWDKETQTIVNNESSEIIRMFNSEFNELTGDRTDYYPEALRKEIDVWNERIYPAVNNGVYKCGFARTQEAYNEAVENLFCALDELDNHFKNKKFLVGETLTEADLRLIPTLLRFDIVYYTHFKTNVQLISEYENLSRYTRSIFEIEEVKKNHFFDHIKEHYYYSHGDINPHRIIPKGPKKFL